jgi:hypothetical protein
MAKKTILEGQSFFDVSLELYGTHERANEIAALYDEKSVSTVPTVGTVIDFEPSNDFVVTYYNRNKLKPASSDFNSFEDGSGFSPEYSNEYSENFLGGTGQEPLPPEPEEGEGTELDFELDSESL